MTTTSARLGNRVLVLALLLQTALVWGSTPTASEPATTNAQGTALQPRYSRASYANESVSLQNSHMRVILFKRLGGWGWGEISSSKGKFMAVLDHFGEILLRDQEIPMRLEAETYRKEPAETGQRLLFTVKTQPVQENLKGTSFEPWIRYPFADCCLTGIVTLTLEDNSPRLLLSYRLRSTGNFQAHYVRGPWLKVGQDSFGTAKDDAIFPGVEWLMRDEWSSGCDWFKDPWALRAVPHPNKVSIPLIAVSHERVAISLSWNPLQNATRWFNCEAHVPQPVFASPNFIDRMNNSVLGLMVPDASRHRENQVRADPPLELHPDQRIDFDAEVFLTDGNSLDAVVGWVKQHHLPEPTGARSALSNALERIVTAYNSNLWHEGQGFGTVQGPHTIISRKIAPFLDRWVKEHVNSILAKELQTKIQWCRGSNESITAPSIQREASLLRGRELLKMQRRDGSFPFDPDGLHRTKDDFAVARSIVEPMGLAGDTALEVCMQPTRELLELAQQTGDASLREGARRTLDFCMAMQRPEGGDLWETPLHAPNLLAAGNAAITYYEGYRVLNEERYKQKAIYWIRSLLPFTHLWEPTGMPMLYNTKPCLCASDWYFANWVRDHVQWEVLSVFNQSTAHGIRWDQIDPEIDWKRFHLGITTAGTRWLSDHRRDDWRPHNIPASYESYLQGAYDCCFPDTHNSTTGHYGGMFIMPDAVAENIFSVLDAQE